VFIQMVNIELVNDPQKAQQLSQLLAEVWGEKNSISVDVIIAVVHSGGYASLAISDLAGKRQVVGGSLALVGRRDNKLHSHVTGIRSGLRNSGLGSALKQHQWEWAKENDFASISWTFDPLVRRNAHFNLVTLGAKVVSYHRDFYGELEDVINSGDKTDRLVVERQVAHCDVAPHAEEIISEDGDELIETPQDIVALRQSGVSADQALVRKVRLAQREKFEAAFAASKIVRGFTADGSYVISSKVR
jgi:predicted GNAT superfamily acetyltransferase